MVEDPKGRKRVVITGMGAVVPLGLNVDEYWKNLIAGKSGIDKITLFDASDLSCQIAGEVKGFDPLQYIDR
ncbi:MAG: ketosynthase chain-length factor, partial [Anaerolineales bacterium]|nr:ketosynthase chain-length factor [Anaerolineales bacterium]